MEEMKTIAEWCLEFKIRLLDESYYKSARLYTAKEFEQKVPRDIQVPLNNENYIQMENEARLVNLVNHYYENKTEQDRLKKMVDSDNNDIKELMTEMGLENFETDRLIAKMSTQKRESFIDEKLLQRIKELNIEGVIKTTEYVDMDALEDAIYNGKVDATKLSDCRQTKEVVTLRVTERKLK